jgi:hypothetical protein
MASWTFANSSSMVSPCVRIFEVRSIEPVRAGRANPLHMYISSQRLLTDAVVSPIVYTLDGLLVCFRCGYSLLAESHWLAACILVQTLRAAQANPEKYRDPIVRVAGHRDYFCGL